MNMKRTEIPKFGPLSGIRVLASGSNVSGPAAAGWLADFGADVLFMERPFAPDAGRMYPSASYNKKHTNNRSLVLDWGVPEGREAYLKYIKDVDILIENSKGGQMDLWDLSDETLWGVNPKLVIMHVSGFGQTGDTKYIRRGGYDAIAQAFSGHMSYNGYAAPEPPMCTNNYTADYFTANVVCWASLMCYINAQKTGKGESVDVAQFEVMFANQAWFEDYVNYGVEFKRNASRTQIAGWDAYDCTDGFVFVCPIGPKFMAKGLPFLGIDPKQPALKGKVFALIGTPEGDQVIKAIKEYCSTRTMQEVEDELNEVGLPTSVCLDYESILHNSHYIARESFIEYEQSGRKYIGANVMPKLKNFPGRIWRPAPMFGEDNEDVLNELGYTTDQIQEMYMKKILAKNEDPDQGFNP